MTGPYASGTAPVITTAALCPSPPLLHPAVTGGDPVLPELRAACAEVARRLVNDAPELIVVIGPADATGAWDAASRLDPSRYAPGTARTGTRSLPLPLGLGAMLLDQAGYRGPRALRAVSHDEPAGACASLGAELAGSGARTALLVMGDGSARRTLKAPGYLDPRAAAFDADVETAVREGEISRLQQLDANLARDLMATGRPAWQVLSGALVTRRPVTEVLYCDAPFGVGYLVAYLRSRQQIATGPAASPRVARKRQNHPLRPDSAD